MVRIAHKGPIGSILELTGWVRAVIYNLHHGEGEREWDSLFFLYWKGSGSNLVRPCQFQYQQSGMCQLFYSSSFSPGNFIFHQRFLLFIFEMSQFLCSLYPRQEGTWPGLTWPDLVINNWWEVNQATKLLWHYDSQLRLPVTSSIVPPSFGLCSRPGQAVQVRQVLDNNVKLKFSREISLCNLHKYTMYINGF